MPSISSDLPGSKVQKFEKTVESVKAATRPAPNRAAQSWMNDPYSISAESSARG